MYLVGLPRLVKTVLIVKEAKPRVLTGDHFQDRTAKKAKAKEKKKRKYCLK